MPRGRLPEASWLIAPEPLWEPRQFFVIGLVAGSTFACGNPVVWRECFTTRVVLIPLSMSLAMSSSEALIEMQFATEVHLIRVTTDDRSIQLWLAATPLDEALDRVLDAVPEGWSTALLRRRIPPDVVADLQMAVGEVRRHHVS